MKKLFSWLTGEVFKKAGDAIDGIITSDEERLQARNALQQVLINEALKSQQIQADIINAEAKGNFLQ